MKHWKLEVKLLEGSDETGGPSGHYKAVVHGEGHPLKDTGWGSNKGEVVAAGQRLKQTLAAEYITAPQALMLGLLATVQMNGLDGNTVAADLRGNADLWRSVAIGPSNFWGLRDLGYGRTFSADTILAVVPEAHLEAFLRLAKDCWTPDEVGYMYPDGRTEGYFYSGEELRGCVYPAETGEVFVRLWWD